MSFKCTSCGHRYTSVLQTQETWIGCWRRRECRQCKHRFSTTEILIKNPEDKLTVDDPIYVLKSNLVSSLNDCIRHLMRLRNITGVVIDHELATPTQVEKLDGTGANKAKHDTITS